MARPQGPYKVKKNLNLEAELCSTVDILLTPPGETEPPHGAWSGLIESLLRQHIKNLSDEARQSLERRYVLRTQKLKNTLKDLI